MTEYLSLEDLLVLASDLCVGPVRDLGLLEAAVRRPKTSLFGTEAYSSVHEKAAVLLDSVVRNHALVDGNKRLGWLSVVVFYGLNGLVLDAPDDEAYDLVISIASGTADHHETAVALETWVH
ncbi:type II toxin-antitoxin system death-on-curing family toxin [Ancrocorticia sp.]|uniref:type II toxin-antitoxin system death-on-curing family toxin n=1 Tax=Ancrocorticia sp. TaxID=2593684 RepID=UPI003F92ADD3